MEVSIPISELDELKAEKMRLELRVKALEKELYGSWSDRRKPEDPNQATFTGIDGTAVAQPESTVPAGQASRKERKGKKKGPKPLNPDLPRVQERIADPDLKELICPVTGAPMKPVFEEKIEILCRKPAEYYVKVFVRQVFASAQGDAMAYSPWPSSVMPRSRIDASVVGSILCARFADHQPYHRQSVQLARHGVDIARNTLCSLVRLAEEKLQRIYQTVVRQTLAHDYLMMDPTPVRLKSDKKKGSTKEGCL
jgi:transposase